MPFPVLESLSNIVTTAQLLSITELNVTSQCYMHFPVSVSIFASTNMLLNRQILQVNFKHTISNDKFKAVQVIILSKVLPALLL